MSFFDTFADNQSNNTTLNSSGLTQWGPTPSSRELQSTNNQSIAGGVWNIVAVGPGNQYFMIYHFDQNGGVSQDFSNLLNIQLDTIAGPGMILTLTDINNVSGSLAVLDSPTLTWSLNDPAFDAVDKTQIIEVEFQSLTSEGGIYDNLRSTIVCLAKDTKILLSNGQIKPIQTIQRGDLVVSDHSLHSVYKVARVNTQTLDGHYLANFVVFAKNCLGNNQPDSDLISTENHPIVFRGKRRPAKCFKNCPLVTFHSKIPVSQILPVNSFDDPHEAGKYTLYDLQFEIDGSYVANGVVVQSRSPRSEITPLPRELYFNQELYTDAKVWDTYDHPLSLDRTVLDKVYI